ncbi:MAG: EAL domain-containing protein [Formivibrio sp.]|nr:EAL domain-containing protein [Formivibrio sp.]
MTENNNYWRTGWLLCGGLLLLTLLTNSLNYPVASLRFICPVNGVAAAFLLVLGYRFWPFLLPALLLVPMLNGQASLLFVAGKSVISLGVIFLAAHLFSPLVSRRRLRLAGALRLLFLSGLVLAVLTVSLSSLLHFLTPGSQHAPFSGYKLFSAWMAEVLGYLFALPLVLLLRKGWRAVWRERGIELCIALLVSVVGVWLLYRTQKVDAGGWHFLFFPVMIWVALRLGQGGVALISLVLAVLLGPIFAQVPGAEALPPQLLVLNLAVTGLLLAALSEEETSTTREISSERHTLNAILNALPTHIFLENIEGNLVYVNRAFARLAGRSADELTHSSSVPVREKLGLPAIPPGTTGEDFECTVNVGSDSRTLVCNNLALYDTQGKHYGDCFIATDITDRLVSEQQLRLAAQVFESASEGIVMTDARGKINAVNPAFSRITGFAAEEAMGKTCNTFRYIEKGTSMKREIHSSLARDGMWQGELPGRRKNGEVYPAWGSLCAVRDEDGRLTHYVAVFSDFTARKEVEDRLQFLAKRDPLTLLHNRTALQEKLDKALVSAEQRHERLALFFIDLDRFKVINDSLGHAFGDELLQVIALRLRFCLKEHDFIARFGGDEFTVIIEDAVNDEAVTMIAERIISEIARPCIVRGQELFVTCSIGISRYPNDAMDATALMRMADMAMYRAKEQGKNTFRFHANDISDQVSARNQLEGHLRSALARNQFVLYFQPLYDLAGEDYYGVEALVRWHHPELGMVPPASFIPLAEESGLIEALGTWVIHEACRQIREWLDVGIDPRQVSVNLSPRQFKRGKLVDTIQRALDNAGLPPERLTLEITESIIMQNPDEAREILSELRDMGVRVAIDDFGSGYSSLAYLKLFPLDTLKIDRAFISPLPDDSDSAAIVEAIVAMSRKLKLTVVAEGVETAEQSTFLRGIGCDIAQGYLYSRPLSAEMLPSALQTLDFPT